MFHFLAFPILLLWFFYFILCIYIFLFGCKKIPLFNTLCNMSSYVLCVHQDGLGYDAHFNIPMKMQIINEFIQWLPIRLHEWMYKDTYKYDEQQQRQDKTIKRKRKQNLFKTGSTQPKWPEPSEFDTKYDGSVK